MVCFTSSIYCVACSTGHQFFKNRTICFFFSHEHVEYFLANAWEEEDEIVLVTCRLENLDLEMVSGSVKEKLENFKNELYALEH